MRPAIRLLLRKLARRFPGRVGILSGRSLKHLRRKVGVPDLIYGGTHGFEIKGPDFSWEYPLSRRRKKLLQVWIREWRGKIKAIPGLWIENKGWTACLHFRETRIRDRHRLQSLLRKICNQTHGFCFQYQKGLQSLEFYSDDRWNKGQATCWLKKHCQAAAVFYVGDDTTDETVFRALGRTDVTIRVGRSQVSRARYYLKQQSESEKLLKRILSL